MLKFNPVYLSKAYLRGAAQGQLPRKKEGMKICKPYRQTPIGGSIMKAKTLKRSGLPGVVFGALKPISAVFTAWPGQPPAMPMEKRKNPRMKRSVPAIPGMRKPYMYGMNRKRYP